MDLFARELLLPRNVARALAVDQRLSASAIATRLGAPFEVVTQPLFDAARPTNRAARRGQRRRLERPARSPARPSSGGASRRSLVLEAGPWHRQRGRLGSPRSRAFWRRALIPAYLAVDLSNEADGSMAERIARSGPRPPPRCGSARSTPRSRYHPSFPCGARPAEGPADDGSDRGGRAPRGGVPAPELAHYRNLYDPTQIIADILAAVSRAKDEVVDAETYVALADAMLAKAAASPHARLPSGPAR